MILKEFRELRRDHRTMAMLIVLPILLLVVFGYAANFSVDTVDTAALGPQAQQLADAAPAAFAVEVVDPTGDANTARNMLRDNEVDVAIVTGSQPVQAFVDGSSLFAAQKAVAVLGQTGANVEVLYNPDLTTAWVMVPALTGLILMFIGTVVTSIGLVRERENGTLEQLAVMPLRPSSVIVGKITPYFGLAALDMTIVTVLGVLLFDVPFNGNIALFALGAALFLFVVLGIGVFISTVSQTAGQSIQLAFFFLLPQILLSGMIFPLLAIPWGVRWISYVLPLTYYTNIAQGVMLRGAGLDSLWPSYLVLAGMATVVFVGAVLRFRRDLAPGRRQQHGRHERPEPTPPEPATERVEGR
jgi:ABC-2 type transport system permease protein